MRRIPFNLFNSFNLFSQIHQVSGELTNKFSLFNNISKIKRIKKLENKIKFKIISTPILNFLPQLKLHHIILIPETDNKNIYVADFTPINQTKPSTLRKLLFGYNVPAEIRIRHVNLYKFNLTYDDINNNNKIFIDAWFNTTTQNYILSQQITDQTLKKIKNRKIKNFITSFIFKNWNTSMNLYRHNCQHFSKYLLIIKN